MPKNKKFLRIKLDENLLDSEGKTKIVLLNIQGAVIVPKDKLPPQKVHSVPVYILTDEEEAKRLKIDLSESEEVKEEENREQKTEDSKEEEGYTYPKGHVSPGAQQRVGGRREPQSEEKKIEEVQKELRGELEKENKNEVKKYDEVADSLNTVFTMDKVESYVKSKVDTITENLMSADSSFMNKCIQFLRTSNNFTIQHSLRVALLFAQAIEDLKKENGKDAFYELFKSSANQVSFAESAKRLYCVGALAHDIGKSKLNPAIFNKHTALTPIEFDEFKKHPRLGVGIMREIGINDKHVTNIVANHHANYLAFDYLGQSPLAVVCNIIDIYDACVSTRLYGKKMTYLQILQILEQAYKKFKWPYLIYNVLVYRTIDKFENSISYPEMTK
ncbi:HD-GYP domain-containing protein [Spirochaetota bacterium]